MTAFEEHSQAIFQSMYDKMYCEELSRADYDTALAEERTDARFLSAFNVWDSFRAAPDES